MDESTACLSGWPMLRGKDGSFDAFAATALFLIVFWVVATLWWWDAPLRLTIFVKRRILGDKKAPRLPPGGMGLPFVGEIPFILLGRNPDKLGAYRANKAKLGEISCGSSPPLAMHSITLCSHDAVKWGLSMENRGLEGYWPESTQTLLGKNSLSILTGKAHKRMRSALIPVFQPHHLRQYVECMNEIVKEHLAKEWTTTPAPVKGSRRPATKKICARDEMKTLTFKIIADLVLGLDLDKERDTVEELNQLFDVWLKGLFMPAIKIPGSPYLAALKAHEQIKTILSNVIQRRRRDSTVTTREKRDVIDIMLAPTKDDAGQEILLDNDEIFDTLVVLLFAGSDTSTCTMTWVLKFLCENPNVLDRLRKEHLKLRQTQNHDTTAETHIDWDEIDSLRYTNQVIFEVLRMHPPVGGSFRKVKRDLVYNGYLVPKGYTVTFDYQSMMQDPKYHGSSTLLFNPDRFESDTAIGGLSNPGFQPFGGGARMCIGYRLAIAEMNVFIHHMVLDYEWTPSPDSQDEVTYFPLTMQVDGVPLDVKRRDRDTCC
jgi:cytochrome P450 family 26 subfamily A